MRAVGSIGLFMAAAMFLAVGPTTVGRAATDPPTIPARFGDHPGFSRAVFDWPARVDYKIEIGPGKAIIRFGRPAKIPLRRFVFMAPKYINKASSRAGKAGAVVEFDIPPGAAVRHYRVGPRVVVDVHGATAPVKVGRTDDPKMPSAGEGTQAPAKTPHPRKPHPKKPVAPKTAEASVQPEQPKPAMAEVESEKPKPVKASIKPERPEPAKAAANNRLPTPKQPTREPIPLIVDESVLAPTDKPLEIRPPPPDPTGTKLIVGAHRTAEGVRLTFSWDKPTAAAVFARADHLWVVFNRPRIADLAAVSGLARAELAGMVRVAEQIPSRRATILRFRVEARLGPAVSRLKNAWIVDLKDKPSRPKSPIVVNPEPIAPGGPRVFLSALEVADPLAFEDPEVGDTLIVVPLAGPDQGVVSRRRFVQFAILETVQGIAIVPKAKGIQVTPARTGVAISNTQGLLISHAWS